MRAIEAKLSAIVDIYQNPAVSIAARFLERKEKLMENLDVPQDQDISSMYIELRSAKYTDILGSPIEKVFSNGVLSGIYQVSHFMCVFTACEFLEYAILRLWCRKSRLGGEKNVVVIVVFFFLCRKNMFSVKRSIFDRNFEFFWCKTEFIYLVYLADLIFRNP